MSKFLSEFKKLNPQLSDVPDAELAEEIRKQKYSDMDPKQFYDKIGLESPQVSDQLGDLFQKGIMQSIGQTSKNIASKLGGPKVGPAVSSVSAPIAKGMTSPLISALNLAPEAIEKITGKKMGRYPKLEFGQDESPMSQGLEVAGEFMTPGLGTAFSGGQKLIEAAPIIKKLSPLLKKVLGGAGSGAGLGFAGSEDGRKGGAEIGAGLGAIPGAVEAGKSAYKAFNKPQILADAEQKLADATGLKAKKSSQAVKDYKRDAANYVNDQIQNVEGDLKQSELDVRNLIPQKSRMETRENLIENTRKAWKNFKSTTDKNYSKIRETFGKKPVNEPFSEEDLSEIVKIGKPGTKKMAKDLTGNKLELDIFNPSEGKNFEVSIPPEKGTAQDYIDFMREVRDVGHHLKGELKDPNLTQSDKNSLLEKISKFNKVTDAANQKIEKTLNPDELKQFNKAQDYHRRIIAPMKETPEFKRMWATPKGKGQVKGDVWDSLLQQGTSDLRPELMKRPDFKQALVEHVFREGNHPMKGDYSKQANQISDLLTNQKDLMSAMDDPVKKALSKHLNLASKRQILDKAKTKVNPSEIQREIQKADIDFLKQYSPEMKKALEKIHKEQLNADKIKALANDQGLNAKELQKAAKERMAVRRSIAKKIGTGLTGMAAYGGYRGAKTLLD